MSARKGSPAGPRRYRILDAVGKGAFGTVYRAQMSGEGGFTKDVAIKLMNPDLEHADEVAARQRDEARLLGLIRHRAILQVDGLVRLNGTWAVVMEYIDGADLMQILRAGPVPPSCALSIVSEVAGALAVAFEATNADGTPLNIVHRDIKPANLQLSTAGEVKLLDFGVARAKFDTREAETVGVILGTMRYMAPERLDGIDGSEGDIYALGVVLVELLTRKPLPKTSSNPHRHAETLAQAESVVREALGPGHDGLVRLIADCLAYEPAARPTARQLEQRTWALTAEHASPRLGEWASVRVREVQARIRAQIADDPLTGETLVEQSGTMSVRPDELTAGSRSATLTVARVGGVVATLTLFGGLAAVAAAVLIALILLPGLTASPPDIRPPVAAPILAVGDGEFTVPGMSVVAAGVEDAEPEPVAPRPVAVPAPVPVAVPAPVPVAEPTSDGRGEVQVRGDTTAVRFVGAGGAFPVPGRVPAGTWDVTYGGVETLKGVQVRAGGTLVISCSASFSTCKLAQ